MPHDAFISYSSHDKVHADAVCAGLEAAGIRCWIAPRDIAVGASYGGEIVRAIRDSKVMVVIFSRHSNGSANVMREVERAVSADVMIVPFRIEDVKPSADMEFFLSVPHWLDALSPPLESHIVRLSTRLRTLIGSPDSPPPFSDRASASVEAIAPLKPTGEVHSDGRLDAPLTPNAKARIKPVTRWPNVIGIASVCVGVLCLLIGANRLVSTVSKFAVELLPVYRGEGEHTNPAIRVIMSQQLILATSIAAVVLAMLLIAAGYTTTKHRACGRLLHLIYATIGALA